MTYKFTESGGNVLEIANQIARQLGANYIGTEHILFGLASVESGLSGKILNEVGVDKEQVLEKIGQIGSMNINPFLAGMVVGYTPKCKSIIESAFYQAKKLGSNYIGSEHLLIAIITEEDTLANRILQELNVDIDQLISLLNDALENVSKYEDGSYNNSTSNGDSKANYKSSFKSTPTLNQFGNDLTKQAQEGKLDPVIGRKEETERVVEILSRRTKNNPCLIGEPGVGKTAVVEGLAQKIASENVPELLKNKRVVALDLSSMIAGSKYRGDFEERIKKVLDEVKKAKDVILFIDEVHTLVGAGSAEGAMDAANILKPMLARGEIQVVGATTLKEYRQNIEKDAALERRFQPIIVDEPTIDECKQILEGLRDKYEAHHNVKITDEAINAAVELSSRYINDRFLPDKAIDLIDEACSKARLKTYIEPDSIKKLQDEKEKVNKEKEEAVSIQDFEKAAKLRDDIKKIDEKLDKEKADWNDKKTKKLVSIGEDEIAEIIARWTGIPTNKITESENERLKHIEDELHKRVIGQDKAVHAVANAIRRSRVGLKDPNRPIGTFLFLGPTGVGKTELTKALAECLFGNENSMIRIDMSEYMESFSTSKLIGAAPGYIGYDEAGGLTEKVRRKPYSVVLFDEIEKAHPDVMNILLQILDDGRLTDNQGRTVSFKNTVIIMTSNVGARAITDKNSLGFTTDDSSEKENQEMQNSIMHEVKNTFKPEFLNRIDETIVFSKLTQDDIKKIIDNMIANLQKRMQEKNIVFDVDDKAKKLIEEKGTDLNYGARPLRRAIQTLIEDKIADEILNGNIVPDKKVTISEKDGEIIILENKK